MTRSGLLSVMPLWKWKNWQSCYLWILLMTDCFIQNKSFELELRLKICLNWTKHGSDKLKNFLKRCVSWVKSRYTPLVEVNQAKCLVLLDKFQVSKSRKSLYFGVSSQSSIKSTNNRIANFSIFWRHTAEMTRLGR